MQEKLGKGGLHARKTCVNGSAMQEKLGKGGLMQEGPV